MGRGIPIELELGRKTRRLIERFLPPVIETRLVLDFGRVKIEGVIMAFQLGDANKVEGRLKPVDSRGNPVSGVQNVVFSVSDQSLATVGASESTPEDPLAFSLAAAGPLGSFQFQYSFDGDPGEGVVQIQGAADVEIVAGLATGAAVEFGEQVPQ